MVVLSCFSQDGSKRRGTIPCLIELLDNTSHVINVNKHCKGQLLMNDICKHLNIFETDYFGLRLMDEAKTSHWLDLQKTLIKEIRRHGLYCNPVKFYFGIKFYATDPCKLKEEVTRYQFFLQLKRDVLDGRISLAFDTMVDICSLVVQSELGDYHSDTHTAGYVSELRLVAQQSEDLEQAIALSHQKLIGFHPSACEYMYLDKMKWQDMYGVDLHLVKGAGEIEYCIGLTPSGVLIYRQKVKVGLYFWPRISGITFKGKRFDLKVRDKNAKETTYYFTFENKESCKSFWKCCIEHHTFFRLSQADLSSNIFDDFFHLGSKFRYSGRTEKELSLFEPPRNPRTVTRTKSQRQERRQIKSNDLTFASPLSPPAPANRHTAPQSSVEAEVKVTLIPQALSSTNPSHTPSSKTQTSSQHPNNEQSSLGLDLSWLQGGLYTSGKESPKSVRSEKMKFPCKLTRTDSCSDAESVYTRRRFNRKESDNESERSAMSKRRRRRYQRSCDSGSDGESVIHRRRRSQRHYESLGEGSICSGVSSPRSDLVSRCNRSYRNALPRSNLSKELAKHLNFALLDTHGLSDNQLKDINYTSVRLNNQREPERISPSDTYENTTLNRRSSSGLQESATSANHTQEGISSCSYENILYDHSGSAHFISVNDQTADTFQPKTYSDYGEVVAPPRVESNQTGTCRSGSSRHFYKIDRKSSDDVTARVVPVGSDHQWVQPVAVYKHTEQRPLAKIVDTQNISSLANICSPCKAVLRSHGKDFSKKNGHSATSLTKRTPMSGSLTKRTPMSGSLTKRTPMSGSLTKRTPMSGSFYAQYSTCKTGQPSQNHLNAANKSTLKISNI